VLWDRLRVEAPVYPGDIIRVANLSAATLNIDGRQIDLDENTLIRILPGQDGSDAPQIELSEGSLGVTTGEEGGLQLAVQGRIIKMGAGTTLSAAVREDGFSTQVNKGTAALIEEDKNREVTQGTMLSFNAEGAELRQPAVVVTQPRPNARYVKNTPQPLPLSFAWNRINLETKDRLRLEIAGDRNFNRVVQSFENLNASAEVSLDTGLWNWRLSYNGAILSTGRLSVTETSNLNLLSPVKGSIFLYQDDPPLIWFQWSEIEGASYYTIEISPIRDFATPYINAQTTAPSFTGSRLGPGIWYWRVQPFFPPAYEGIAGTSQTSWFDIKQAVINAGDEKIVLPAPKIEPVAVVEETPPVKETPPVEKKAPPVQQVKTPPPPPLPPPGNMRPANGYRIGIEELKAQKGIVFRWSGVTGANAYIITLYKQTENGRQQIRRIPLGNSTTWTLEDIGLLGRGEFVWRVEAVYNRRNGTVERSGRPGENSFLIDIPIPKAHMEDPGVLYGD